MNERPIIMTAESVRAILAGRKTQTRRVVKPPARVAMIEEIVKKIGRPERHLWEGDLFCPYGEPGDRLWVREAWRIANHVTLDGNPAPMYRATYDEPLALNWRPSIHMRRDQSRIDLEIVGVKVQRLQAISDAEIMAEGFLNDRISRFPVVWDEINAKRGYPWASNPWVWVIEFKKL